MKRLLKTNIEAAMAMKMVKPVDFERVIVDTTVQEMAFALRSESRVPEVARYKIVRLAKSTDIGLENAFERETEVLCR